MGDEGSPLWSRRRALGFLGTVGAVGVATACSSATKSVTPSSRSTSTRKPSGATGASATSCVLAPELTQGPFFLTDHPNASNVVQDRKGVPLTLALAVDSTSCAAIEDATVDIWHCDAAGVYAGVSSGAGGGPPGGGGDSGAATRANRDTWLQGYQTTDADGTVRFTTIYPGWYQGRAVHIHVKVFVGGEAVHTGQLFFPDTLSERVFARSPYRGTPDTLNDADSVYASAGSAALLAPKRDGDGYTARGQLVVS